MRAVVMSAFGSEGVLEVLDVPVPALESNEVLVTVDAAAVNHVDLDIRNGTSRFPVQLPHILGREGAGVVTAVGHDADPALVGERVAILPARACGRCPQCARGADHLCEFVVSPGLNAPGTYAEYVVGLPRDFVPLPSEVETVDAAASLISFGTAWHMLVGKARIQRGQTVLVCGAAGGLGVAAVQIATYLGARVIAAASSRSRLDHASHLGAALVDYSSSDLPSAVRELTRGRGCDVVIEHIGGQIFEDALACTAVGGCVVTAGAHAGEVVALDVIPFFRRELRIYGSRGQGRSDIAQVVELLRLGAIDPVVDRLAPIELAADVHRAMANRELVGKALLRP